MPSIRVEPLASHHNRAAFVCVDGDLGAYFKERATQDVRRKAAAVFVAVSPSDPDAIMGYYTLSSFSLKLHDIPPEHRRKLAAYPDAGTTLLGRLAVDAAFRGQRIGEFLLMDALRRAAAIASEVATVAVVVDALASAEAFYTRYGFVRLSRDRFWIPIQTIQQLFPSESFSDTDAEEHSS
jgi:predicted GNAT family N-acyltransferase